MQLEGLITLVWPQERHLGLTHPETTFSLFIFATFFSFWCDVFVVGSTFFLLLELIMCCSYPLDYCFIIIDFIIGGVDLFLNRQGKAII